MSMRLFAIGAVLLGLFAAIVSTDALQASSRTAATATTVEISQSNDCCFPGSPCCFPGSPCCEVNECCLQGAECCAPASSCCLVGAPVDGFAAVDAAPKSCCVK